jgi:hypothetical protein
MMTWVVVPARQATVHRLTGRYDNIKIYRVLSHRTANHTGNYPAAHEMDPKVYVRNVGIRMVGVPYINADQPSSLQPL